MDHHVEILKGQGSGLYDQFVSMSFFYGAVYLTPSFHRLPEHTTPNNSHVPAEFAVSGMRITFFAQTFKLLLQDFQFLIG